MYAIQKNSPAMSLLPQPCDSCLPEVKAACAAGTTKCMTAKNTARFMVQVDRKNWVMIAALVIIASMGGLILFQQMQPVTGFSILPTGDFAGVSYEMLYIMISALVIGLIVGTEAAKRF